MSLRLLDLLRLANVELGRFKIHLATGRDDPPLTAYYDGRFKAWQERQNGKNFECDSVVSLIYLQNDRWLFVGIWKILGSPVPRRDWRDWFEYKTEEVGGIEHLCGRAVVSFTRSFRASYLRGDRFGDKLIVTQLLEEKQSMGEFPGYSSVLIRHDQLRHIVNRDLATWRSALSNVAGVYLISDTTSGKHYVGSAYGTDGIWGRWICYSTNGHGNNRELIALLSKRGADHARHFQYSILEICDLLAQKSEVWVREGHWKDALCSRQFGHNSN